MIFDIVRILLYFQYIPGIKVTLQSCKGIRVLAAEVENVGRVEFKKGERVW